MVESPDFGLQKSKLQPGIFSHGLPTVAPEESEPEFPLDPDDALELLLGLFPLRLNTIHYFKIKRPASFTFKEMASKSAAFSQINKSVLS